MTDLSDQKTPNNGTNTLRKAEHQDLNDRLGTRQLHPETLMVGFAYDPSLSEGAVKPPVFLTSTFVFRSAEEGKAYFDVVAGRKEAPPGGAGLVYSRFNHPNGEIAERRLAAFENAEEALIFSSGMSAITTTILAYTRPGDVVLHSQPLYGGTETLLTKTLANYGILAEGFSDGLDFNNIEAAANKAISAGKIQVIFIETPSNPLNTLVDFSLIKRMATQIEAIQGSKPLIICDNTMLGPVFQRPLMHGVDVVVYSLTKYIGGHSDLIGGSAAGAKAILRPIRLLRGAIGTQLDPHSSWMLTRSLETLSLRMNAASENARKVAEYLASHPQIAAIHSLGHLPAGSHAMRVYDSQCSGPGSTFSIAVKGGEAEAFRVLNSLKIFKLAVSLGGTESLASHPASTTHSGVPLELRERIGVTDSLIRLSIGIEHHEDLIADLDQALAVL